MDISHRFGAALRSHREELHISQEDLADRAGMDRTYLSGIERGVRNPTLKVMQRLAEALGVELDIILATARKISHEEQSPTGTA